MPLRIFVTTDNHVGYNELDPVRGEDAAKSFDEAMSIALSSDVDFVIQGGDLFHLNKPSKHSLYAVMKTLRRTCLGDKPVEFQVLNHGPLALSDAAKEFDFPNFEDPNINVGLPVFAISGNHDDAGGSRSTNLISPLDVLSMAGLINHFGRINDATNIIVTPILIQKEGIRVALYGMASVRDERLYRTFRDNKVKFLRPKDEPETWYNILVVHQNHSQHGHTNFLPEQFLPNFIDLVIWGHEHECLIDPVENPNKGFKVMQPGSTVATSLSESEIAPKHVAIITIAPNKLMSVEKLKLRTVRPIAMKTVVLSRDASHINVSDREARGKITQWLMGEVESLIVESKDRWNADHGENAHQLPAPLPLIRLRADYSGGYEVENTTRFSNRFVGRVANSNDILHLVKRRSTESNRILPKSSSGFSDPSLTELRENGLEKVGELVHRNLSVEQLKILYEKGMSEALLKFVEKDEKTALKQGVDTLVEVQMKKLLASVNNLNVERSSEHQTTSTGVVATYYPEEDVPTKRSDSKEPSEPPSHNLAEIQEAEQENIMSSEEDLQQPPSAAIRTEPSARTRQTTRRARQASKIAPSPEELEAIAAADSVDDSDEMFSPDEFG